MIVKAVTFFLIAILILGILGRLRLLGPPRPRKGIGRRRGGLDQTPAKCAHCGAYLVGPGACTCGKSA